MAKTKQKENTEPQMEEVLQTIRGVIAGDKPVVLEDEETQASSSEAISANNEDDADDVADDVLELSETQIVDNELLLEQTNSPLQQNLGAEQKPEPIVAESILDNIDQALNENIEPELSASSGIDQNIVDNSSNSFSETVNTQASTVEPEVTAPISKQTPPSELKSNPAEASYESPSGKQKLVSEQAASETQNNLRKLVDNIPKPKIDSAKLRSGTTVEQLVVEALQPYLARWLDDNLPIIVKQIVEKEIRRIVPYGDEE